MKRFEDLKGFELLAFKKDLGNNCFVCEFTDNKIVRIQSHLIDNEFIERFGTDTTNIAYEEFNERGKKMNILYLEKRGCDFWKEDEINNISDLKNYRLFFEGIETKDGKVICGDAFRGSKNINGKSVHMFKLWFDLQFEDERGNTWRYNTDVINKDYLYNSKDLLKAINEISKNKYDKIEIR